MRQSEDTCCVEEEVVSPKPKNIFFEEEKSWRRRREKICLPHMYFLSQELELQPPNLLLVCLSTSAVNPYRYLQLRRLCIGIHAFICIAEDG